MKCPDCQSDVVESTLNNDTIVDVIDGESGEITHELQVYKCTNDLCNIIFCLE